MTMAPRLRKVVLTAHVVSGVGWLGAVAAFLALAVVGLTSQDAQTVRAAWLANELVTWYVIVPLAFASVLIGVLNALGSPWGLFRHYWVLVKFLLTILATVVLLLQTESIGYMGGLAAEATSGADLRELRSPGLVVHAGGGLLVLLVVATLSVFKPRGMTPYGQRKQREQRTVLEP